MNYHDAIDRLYDLKRHAIEPGTARTGELLRALDDPHRTLDTIQIAGTNGKGSTAAMLASILRRGGCRVGLYTSPHLDSVRERIQVDGRPIAKAAVGRFIEQISDELTDAGAVSRTPTFFEAVTAMALWHFAEMDVDVAVLEVGIGGRHDATSVVDPSVTAVTAVSLDHTKVLGSTVEAIATDKVAIAGESTPLVTGTTGRARDVVLGERPDAVTVGIDDSDDVTVTYRGIEERFEAVVEIDGGDWTVETRSPLLGAHQAVNAAIAATISKHAWSVDGTDIATGIRSTDWPGRGEVIQRDPTVMLDGAHNPAAADHLAEVLGELSPDAIHLVVGIMADKDLPAIADSLAHVDSVTACRPTTTRAAPPEAIARAFANAGVTDTTLVRSVEDAVGVAIDEASPDDLVCVTGSLFTVGEARRRWRRRPAVRHIEHIAGARTMLNHADVTETEVSHLDAAGVHRVVHLRVDGTRAQHLKQELVRVGGECAISGVTADGELQDVILMGTLEQFEHLREALITGSHGLSYLAEQLGRALTEGHSATSTDWPWADGPIVMGIVNVTPDSFYDGGEAVSTQAAIERVQAHIAAGASIVDIGGESTRPGGDPVPVTEELDRVLPVIEGVADVDALVSVDTQKAEVATAALDAGADIVNDISGLSDPAMAPTVASYDAPIVVGHSLSTPVEPGLPVEYDDVVRDVGDHLMTRIHRCERAGIDRSNVIIDPGIGFNKSPAENFELIARLREFEGLGFPILLGHSQKSLFEYIGYAPNDRDVPTVVTSALAAMRGADILRVHEVAPTVAALETAGAIRQFD